MVILSYHLRLGLIKVFLQVYLLTFWNHSYLLPFLLHTRPFQSSGLNHSDCIRWTVQNMKFLIVEPSSFLLGPNILNYMKRVKEREHNDCLRKSWNISHLSEEQEVHLSTLWWMPFRKAMQARGIADQEWKDRDMWKRKKGEKKRTFGYMKIL